MFLSSASEIERSIGTERWVCICLEGLGSEFHFVFGTGGRDAIAVEEVVCETEGLFTLGASIMRGEGRGAADGVFQSAKSRGCCWN